MPEKLSTDVVEISSKRAALRQKLWNGRVVHHSNLEQIKIPKCKFAAPRPGFDETLSSYENIVKNNVPEIKQICSKYLNGTTNMKQFADEYAQFLSRKMNMPYYPELKQVIDRKIAGGMQNTTNTIFYNPNGMKRMSDLMQTITHEMHHFLQQKEIFSTISIEDFSRLKAIKDIKELAKVNPAKYGDKSKMFAEISEQTESYIKEYKDAGWDKIIQNYPKNVNPNSPYYKRAQKLLDAELNYNQDGAKYFSNLLEHEAYEVGTHTQIEIEHDVFNTITKQERDTAIQLFDTLNNKELREIPQVAQILNAFKTNPYNIIEVVKDAKAQGLTDVFEIIERLCAV